MFYLVFSLPQVHGPYELVDDEIHFVRSALGAYMSVPFVQIDGEKEEGAKDAPLLNRTGQSRFLIQMWTM